MPSRFTHSGCCPWDAAHGMLPKLEFGSAAPPRQGLFGGSVLPVPPPLKKKTCLGNFEAPVAGFENVVTVGKGFRSVRNLLVHGCIASGTQRCRGLDGAGSLWVPEMELRRCGGTGGESLQLGGVVSVLSPSLQDWDEALHQPDFRNPATERFGLLLKAAACCCPCAQ